MKRPWYENFQAFELAAFDRHFDSHQEHQEHKLCKMMMDQKLLPENTP